MIKLFKIIIIKSTKISEKDKLPFFYTCLHPLMVIPVILVLLEQVKLKINSKSIKCNRVFGQMFAAC